MTYCVQSDLKGWLPPDDEGGAPSPSLSRAFAGVVAILPGAPAQGLHRDGPDAGLFNVFVPLSPLDGANDDAAGPTQFALGTHNAAAAPHPRAAEGGGEALEQVRGQSGIIGSFHHFCRLNGGEDGCR